MSFKSTLVAHNEDANCTNNGGTLTSEGYNLEFGDTCVFTTTGDITDTNPLLGPLADNGGPSTGSGQATLTHALLESSPAVDNGAISGYPITDQRGVPRPQGGRCDIGAHEHGEPALAIGKVGPARAPAGNTITYTLAVTNTGYELAESLVISDVLPEGAQYVGGGTLVGNVVSRTLPSLAWWGNAAVSVQLAVTATGTITNDDYHVSASGGYNATGSVSVVTTVYEAHEIYLPLVLKN